ncbi:DUF2938 domain-containing protein [Dokdonella sp.]|uniref:DUF2938 domain-containing protein n=1 Tax=Dokdonella sp. TaxID=2291710 RepID=UPI003784F5EC
MSDIGLPVVYAIVLGIGATALLDLFSWLRQRLSGIAAPDFALVGRWVAHMGKGRFRHDSIAAAAPVRGERELGWSVHYLTGIAFASLLLAVWGAGWVRQPSIAPALIVGVGSVVAPLLLMQPGMGAGIAARRTRNPWIARARSVLTHTVFGTGLYVSAWAISAWGPG